MFDLALPGETLLDGSLAVFNKIPGAISIIINLVRVGNCGNTEEGRIPIIRHTEVAVSIRRTARTTSNVSAHTRVVTKVGRRGSAQVPVDAYHIVGHVILIFLSAVAAAVGVSGGLAADEGVADEAAFVGGPGGQLQ